MGGSEKDHFRIFELRQSSWLQIDNLDYRRMFPRTTVPMIFRILTCIMSFLPVCTLHKIQNFRTPPPSDDVTFAKKGPLSSGLKLKFPNPPSPDGTWKNIELLPRLWDLEKFRPLFLLQCSSRIKIEVLIYLMSCAPHRG